MSGFLLEQQGGFHLWEGCPCQDKVHYMKIENVESVTLCDGAGSMSGALEAARTFSQGINEWIVKHFSTLRGKSDATVRQLVIEEIERLLTCLTAGEETARDIYGCTLLTACRDTRTGEALVLHLGDGVVLTWSPEEDCSCLTHPEQGEALRATWLTNSGTAALMQHLRVLRRRSGREKVDAFILISDGGEGLLYMPQDGEVKLNPVVAKLVKEFMLRPNTFTQSMPDFIRARVRPADDFSIGIIGDITASSLPVRAPRRVVAGYIKYLSARRNGMNPMQAARYAGWRKRDIARKRERLLDMKIEEV